MSRKRALKKRYGRSASADAVIRAADALGIKHHRQRRSKPVGGAMKVVDRALSRVVDFAFGGRGGGKGRALRKRYGRARGSAAPFHGGRCYACDTRATGFRDRRPEGDVLEPACARHRDPKVKTFDACMYCDSPVRKGSVDVDDNFAHKSCHKAASL